MPDRNEMVLELISDMSELIMISAVKLKSNYFWGDPDPALLNSIRDQIDALLQKYEADQ